FICGGAFSGLDELIVQRVGKRKLGFGADVRDNNEELDANELLAQLQPEDLMKYGLIPEFVGRLPVIATLDELDEDALVEILTRPKNALVKQYRKLFRIDGVELDFEEAALRAVSRKALAHKTGARGLRTILERVMLELMYEVPDHGEVKDITITEEMVEEADESPIQFEETKAESA
ncbi:MAG: ATP-dependent Clp protease ATP-binding subunit ClpX, partial [Persicimonas sp.]